MFDFELGTFVTDNVTGFAGIINGRVDWDTGNLQYSVKPRVKENGDMSDGRYIDGDNFLVDNERSVACAHGDPDFQFENGQKVRSLKTPFKGTISSRVQSLNGCLHYQVTGDTLEKGAEVTEFLSETEIELIPDAQPVQRETRRTGGPDSLSPL